MYFPIIRGKQYDLLALRELREKDLINKNIIPIIEPTTISSTLLSTLQTYVDKEHKIGFIINPEVGSYLQEIQNKNDNYNRYYDKISDLIDNTNILKTYVISNDYESDLQELKNKYMTENLIIISRDITLLQNTYIVNFFEENEIAYLLSGNHRNLKRIFKGNNLILKEDSFEKMPRNKDYLDVNDEFFSDTVFHYKEDGFKGFSDYTVIGKEFTDKGFAPYAVSLHLTYESKNEYLDSSEIRVRHFTSESNEDTSFPEVKYGEASFKLKEWYSMNKSKIFLTEGLEEFLKIHDSQKYSGLAIPKKLSIKHHIELMNHIIDRFD